MSLSLRILWQTLSGRWLSIGNVHIYRYRSKTQGLNSWHISISLKW